MFWKPKFIFSKSIDTEFYAEFDCTPNQFLPIVPHVVFYVDFESHTRLFDLLFF